MKRFASILALLSMVVAVKAGLFVSKDIQANMTSSYVVECDETGRCWLILESPSFKTLDCPRAQVSAKNQEGLWRRLATVEDGKLRILFHCNDNAKKYLNSRDWIIERKYS